MQGGSVVKVEEEEETSLRERWVVTCGRHMYVVLVEKDTTEKSKGRARERLISALPHAH